MPIVTWRKAQTESRMEAWEAAYWRDIGALKKQLRVREQSQKKSKSTNSFCALIFLSQATFSPAECLFDGAWHSYVQAASTPPLCGLNPLAPSKTPTCGCTERGTAVFHTIVHTGAPFLEWRGFSGWTAELRTEPLSRCALLQSRPFPMIPAGGPYNFNTERHPNTMPFYMTYIV